MSRILKTAAALLGAAAAAEAAGSAYLYRRTMIRYNAKTERTMKMSGVDWEKYIPMMKERREWMMQQPHEDVWITSHDGLKLHGTYFKGDEGNKAVICFHGYTSEGLNDYGSLSHYYLKHGFRMLLIDLRAHGKSEGEHIGFGNMDRLDGMRWVQWMVEKMGEDAQILLHGNSMGSGGEDGRRRSDPAPWELHGERDGLHDERAGTAAPGQGGHIRLRVHFDERGVHPRAAQHVPYPCIPHAADRRLGE